MGYETITVSIGGDYPGLSVADKYYEIDVRDKESILEIAKREAICGIFTDQTDLPVPTVAYIAEQMGLQGIGYDCALRFTNKYEMRKFCEKINVPVPKYFQASSLKDAGEHTRQLGYPLIVKPVDSQGSRGVAKVNHAGELEKKYRDAISYSACGRVILEEFFSGSEVVVQGFAHDYDFINLVIGDRVYFDLPDMFIPKQTLFPSALKEGLRQKVLELNDRLIRQFAPKFGITHSEFIVQEKTGEIRLMETAVRGGGVFISSDLVPLACDVNVNELLIRLASGRKGIHIERGKLGQKASGYVCFTLPEGVIREVSGIDELVTLPGVHAAYLDDLVVGRRTRQMKDKTMRRGPILVAGADRAALQETINRIQQALLVQIETASGIRGIEW
jgi:carbamoyl-phosphate synthase large subunit